MKNGIELQASQKLWTKGFIVICIIGTTFFLSQYILNNILALFVDSRAGSTSLSGVLQLSFAVGAILSRSVSGRLTDLKGRRVTMIIGTLAFGIATLACNFIPFLEFMLVLRLIHGFGFALVSTAAGAAAVDMLPKNRLNEGIGYYGLAQALASALGPTLGLALIMGSDFRLVFYTAAGILFIGTLFSVFCRYEEKDKKTVQTACETGKTPDVKDPSAGAESSWFWRSFEKRALNASILMLLFYMGTSSVYIFLALVAEYKGFDNVGVFFVLAAISMVAVRLFVGRLADRAGLMKILLPGFISGIICLIVLAFTENNTVFIGVGILYGVSMGIIMSMLNALALKNVPPERRGAANATYYLYADIGLGGGSSIWGIVAEHCGNTFTGMYCGAAASLLIAMVLSIFMFRKKRAKQN